MSKRYHIEQVSGSNYKSCYAIKVYVVVNEWTNCKKNMHFGQFLQLVKY